ncbi:MAG: efflux RND transporter permease subunit [Oligoflexia bacterium]|nr:efflux RND transporter permease subunit [Oligoflexia bacterium]MBF0364788.1 efflux RND transporter permease subunit [Oligoflexia bacterium]
MNIANISLNRPIFVTCISILLLALGIMSLRKMPVDLFPDVTFPVVMVMTPYPGAGPAEVENLVSRKIEEEVSSLPGMKALRSVNREGVSMVIAEFTLETDIKHAEQQIRDKMSSVKRKLPSDVDEPIIRRIDPADQPVLIVAIKSNLAPQKLFELADNTIRMKLEQVAQVGLVEVIGGQKREIQVQLDRDKLKRYELSTLQVTNRIASTGQNIPAGKISEAKQETIFRTVGEFATIKDIEKVVVNFIGNDIPVTVSDLGRVVDTLTDEKSKVFYNGEKSIFLMVYRQSGANTIKVVESVKATVNKINEELKNSHKEAPTEVIVVRDGSKMIKNNIDDVKESIILGIILTIVVVFLFLGSFRSTFITGIAIPNSLIGAFIIMAALNFSINVMTLLALSLAVGLLVDDAIVVRENIFRHNEEGKNPIEAARIGTQEVLLAVVATTATILAVFGPVAFLEGIVGQFFKQFGLTVCFAMVISLYDSLTMAPMLSAYFVGNIERKQPQGVRRYLSASYMMDQFQTYLENVYASVLKFALRVPLLIFAIAIVVFVASIFVATKVSKTFVPAADLGEFIVTVELSPGATLGQMQILSEEIDKVIRANPEIKHSVMVIGGQSGESNRTTFYIELIPSKQRNLNTSAMKDKVREQLKPFAYAKPVVKEVDLFAGGRPFQLIIIGPKLEEVTKIAEKVYGKLKNHSGLKDPEISYKPGKPEFKIAVDERKAALFGISNLTVGQELRNQVEGMTPVVFRDEGQEYDVRVRLNDDDRNLRTNFSRTYVPNINYRLVKLENISSYKEVTGPATIERQDRGRSVTISADIAPAGPGMGGVMADVKKIFENEITLPEGYRYKYSGQAESFTELGKNMVVAAGLGVLFIFLVLASLYESFITPLTIMLVLPLAACGAFFALYITKTSLDIFSMIGCIMLLGLSTKNSILLVDYSNQMVEQGLSREDAVMKAGKTRLRPILMTTAALIAGMIPIAIGLNEASSQRVSMGIAIIGGLVSSTLLTLVVVPAAYSYIDRFRVWIRRTAARMVGVDKFLDIR